MRKYHEKISKMKKSLIYLCFLTICCSLLCFHCGDEGPRMQTNFWIQMDVSDTLNIHFKTPYDSITIQNVFPHAIVMISNLFPMEPIEKNKSYDVFASCIVRGEKRLVITKLSGDTLANWDNNSAVFNDKKHWTIESMSNNSWSEFNCILHLTDELLSSKNE